MKLVTYEATRETIDRMILCERLHDQGISLLEYIRDIMSSENAPSVDLQHSIVKAINKHLAAAEGGKQCK